MQTYFPSFHFKYAPSDFVVIYELEYGSKILMPYSLPATSLSKIIAELYKHKLE